MLLKARGVEVKLRDRKGDVGDGVRRKVVVGEREGSLICARGKSVDDSSGADMLVRAS